MPTKLKPPKYKCCDAPDVKNEGFVNVPKGKSWEYHCYHCDSTWSELQTPSGKVEVNMPRASRARKAAAKKKPSAKPQFDAREIRRYVDVSTGHITEDDSKLLTQLLDRDGGDHDGFPMFDW